MTKYIPRQNDVVFRDGHGFVRYTVIIVNQTKETADISTVASPVVLIRDVPWANLHHLDESQNALRIVKEATEG